MEHEGDISLLSALASGKERIGLLVLSGVMRGVYGGAQASALESRGFQNKFRVIIGVSSGAPVALYFAGGAVRQGTHIYYQEAATSNFISLTHERLSNGTAGDIGYLCKVFRGELGSNSMNLEAMKACPADVYVAVTGLQNGKGELLNVKKALPDPIAAVHASAAIPVLYREPVYVNGIRYIDGSIGAPFPVQEVVNKWHLDGLIVLANRPRVEKVKKSSIGLKKRVSSALGLSQLRDVMHKSSVLFKKGLVEAQQMRSLIIWSDHTVSPYTRDSKLIQKAMHQARAYMELLLREVGV